MRRAAWIAGVGILSITHAQNRNLNWIFAKDVWLKFQGDTLSWQPSSYQPSLRNACISDTWGNFIMLADDRGIHDALFDLMPGGDSLSLDWTVTSSNYIILPKPGIDDHYVVIRCEAEGEQRAGWVEVDMQANAGLGAVVGGTTWFATDVTARLAATPHANGMDYWVMLHEDGTEAFTAYQLTESGILPVPVISHAGAGFAADVPPWHLDFRGPMQFSLQGDWLALAKWQGAIPDTAVIELFDFSDANGSIGFKARFNLTVWNWVVVGSEYYYSHAYIIDGLEFSPSGQHLYTATTGADSTQYTGNGWFQFSLTDPVQAAIQASGTAIGGSGNGQDSLRNDSVGSKLQLAPDGRLCSRQINTDINESLFSPVLFSSFDLPVPVIPVQYPDYWAVHHLTGCTGARGFPTLCKRYHDSAPSWVGMEDLVSAAPAFHIRPNPMSTNAALMLPTEEKADRVEWVEAMG